MRPWTTALALGGIALIGLTVAAVARSLAPSLVEDVETEGIPRSLDDRLQSRGHHGLKERVRA